MGFNLPDAPPTTPNRDNFPPPPYFLSPTVGPSDTSFITPQILKPQILPLIDKYARPISEVIDGKKKKKKKTMSIIPKTPKLEESNLSEQLTQILPNLDDIKKEDDYTFKETVQNLTETLCKIGEDDATFEFEFFIGRKNEKCVDYIRGIGPSTGNIEFLQSNICKKIMIDNRLKHSY